MASVPALAGTCSAANTFAFSYANQAAATLAYGSTYNYTATSTGGATRGFSVTIAQNGLSNTQVAATQMPNISTMITGPTTTANDLVFGGVFSSRTASMAGSTRVITVTFTFAQPIRDFTMAVHDVDYSANQYRDWLQVTGSDGTTTMTPALTTPWGNGNNGVLPHSATGSTSLIGSTTTPLSLTNQQAGGTATSNNNSDDGTINASFTQPVTSVTLKYGNFPLTGSETTTGQQAMGIAGITFCPMPAIAVAKTSAPATGTYGAYNIPGNDVVYTLTVTNSGASPVDGSSIVLTDLLPAATTFRNSAFDGTTTLPVKLVSAGGTTLASANITYSKLADATFTYTPVAGYDAQVDGIKIVPGGQLAANSTLQLQYIVSVK
ncbi:DUF11 domain-containing protein [Novosphingobium lentum]|uniref:DUF11 domain-containing protein n=1 Tax=Novosphingobium lentum TaxID=145287 RepID=UPI0008318511|nr:DUF11 domain-containing protein [Novosphingobium lentum]